MSRDSGQSCTSSPKTHVFILYLRVHVPAWRQLACFDVNQAAVASRGHRFGNQGIPVRPAACSEGSRGALDGAVVGLDNFFFADLEATDGRQVGGR